MLKRSGFKPPTKEKLAELAVKKRERQIAKAKLPKPLKTAPVARGAKPKPKAKRVKLLKTKLWKIFSQYIRKREADHTGWLRTVDGAWVHWKECDCGHLWHNSDRNGLLGGNALWYYENNFAPQSNQGNRLNADDSAQKYMLAATEKYGAEEIKHMRKLKETYKLWTEEELQNLYEHYKRKFEAL